MYKHDLKRLSENVAVTDCVWYLTKQRFRAVGIG